ncbi:uncharacterized protein [Triticum aestivum]|uniref:uncharacterized protein n=1 Tax=Triticum aestivum TaxID=4565 RepID=UPI001D002DD7|nr:uncharacterized protein LOC123084473 [Triticum aestivum]
MEASVHGTETTMQLRIYPTRVWPSQILHSIYFCKKKRANRKREKPPHPFATPGFSPPQQAGPPSPRGRSPPSLLLRPGRVPAGPSAAPYCHVADGRIRPPPWRLGSPLASLPLSSTSPLSQAFPSLVQPHSRTPPSPLLPSISRPSSPPRRAGRSRGTAVVCFVFLAHELKPGATASCGSSFIFLDRRRRSSSSSSNPALLSFHRAYLCLHDPETAADATMFDYITDDPPCLSNQMTESRSQMPPLMTATTPRAPTTT